jgi:hypothetical protein
MAQPHTSIDGRDSWLSGLVAAMEEISADPTRTGEPRLVETGMLRKLRSQLARPVRELNASSTKRMPAFSPPRAHFHI